jgi:hypothetical protein
MSKDRKPTTLAGSKSALSQVAAQIHSYDSFGRAIVSAALKQAEKSAEFGNGTTATVRVVPVDQPSVTFAGTVGHGAAGSHAKGHVPPTFSIEICFGESCHVLSV